MRPALLALIMLLCALPVFAQSDTPTPEPTSILTPTPEVYIGWTLPPRINAEGTAIAPPLDVTFGYTANAGDVLIGLLGAALLFSLIAIGALVLWLSRGEVA